MSSSLSGKIAVIFGASGFVGQGAADAFLKAGAIVVGVGRDASKLQKLKVRKLGNSANFHVVAGDYSSEDTVAKLHADIKAILDGKEIDHIVVSVGFVYFPPGGVSESHQKDLNGALNEGVPQNFLIAREFLPALKSREGSTYTMVSGGLAFFCPQPNFWAATLKNAALNALTLGLAADTKNDKTRVNNLCIFVPVTEIDGNRKNQFGMEGPETRVIGRAFVAVVQGSKRGEVIPFKAATESEIEAAVAELAK